MSISASRLIILTSVFLAISISVALAQTAVTGAITGYVTDSSGAALPAAAVNVTNAATSVTERTVTNGSGIYQFSSLLPGTYSVTIQMPNFKQFTHPGIIVNVSTTVRVDAVLQIGTTTSTVTVTGQAPLLQSTSAEVSQTIGTKEIDTLPTFGRNVTRLGLLAPGAFMVSGQLDIHPENAGEDFNVSFSGGIGGNNSHILDGVDNTEIIQGYSLLVPTQESVREVKLTTSNYDAEFGRVSGAVIQITTKSGTNDLHGSAFEYYRSSSFFARNPFTQPNGVPKNVWNQFGGSLGGPILKKKLFYFGDYQGMRNSLSTSSLYTAPIAAFRTGDFSSVAKTHPIYDPATGNADGTGRTQFPNNIIPPNRISPAVIKLLALVPQPTNPNIADNNYAISRPGIFNQDQFDTRVDYFTTPKTLIFGKFSYFHARFLTDNVFGAQGGGPPLGGIPNSGNSTDSVYSSMVDYQHTFTPTLQQDFRFAFSRIYIQELQLDASSNAADKVGIPNINLGTIYTSGLPELDVAGPTGTFTMGDIGLPFFETETNFEAFDSWTKVAGKHFFKFGGDVEKFYGIRTDVSGRGDFTFSQNVTGNPSVQNSGLGMASFLLGLPSTFGRDITITQPQEKQWRLALYVQDTWQVTPKLTLMLGLRWIHITPIFSQKGQSVGNLDLNTGDVVLTNLAGKYAGVTTPFTEFAPRLGISYRLAQNTMVRMGYGRSYFINAGGASFGTQGCCWPIKQSQSDNSLTPYTPLPYVLDNGPGVPAPLPPFPANGLIPLPNGFSQYFLGVGNYPHSYQDGWNVTLEQLLPHEVTASIGYVGNIGRKLWSNIDVNAPVPGPGPFNPRRPYFAKFGWTTPENQRNDVIPGYPDYRSNYNSLEASVKKRFQSGWSLLSNFTWDHLLNNARQNIFNSASDYGTAGRPFSWISAANLELPFGHGKAFASNLSGPADAIIGGWTLSGIFDYEGGLPYTPTLGNTASLNSTISLRPNRIGKGTVPHPDRNRWFNPSDFTVPALYTYGNSGRGILYGPRYISSDMSLAKAVSFTERVHLTLKWDAFNVFNHNSLATPNAVVDSSTAGEITNIVDYNRRMQIGAHLTF